jgi:hypothetical protein
MTVVGAAGADGDEGAALAQSIPLPIAVDQDAALVKDAIQKKRRLGLHPLQTGDINTASADALKTSGKLVTGR